MSGIMGGVDDAVGRVPQYDVFADEFLDHAESGFFNAYYDRPACLALLGDVAGKRVLDAACGPGLYAAELARRGARGRVRPQPPHGGNRTEPDASRKCSPSSPAG